MDSAAFKKAGETFNRDILTGLLRNELGFNGLIVTDSSTMAGFACAMPREIAVPTAVAAGCAKLCYIILPVWCTPVNSLSVPKPLRAPKICGKMIL